jgi:hypothetical protein
MPQLTTPAVGQSSDKPLPTNPTPKERFKAGKGNTAKHLDLVDSDDFRRSLDFSQLEYCRQVGASVNDNVTAMAAGYKLQGAMEAFRTLLTLADAMPVPTARRDFDNLTPQEPKRQ